MMTSFRSDLFPIAANQRRSMALVHEPGSHLRLRSNVTLNMRHCRCHSKTFMAFLFGIFLNASIIISLRLFFLLFLVKFFLSFSGSLFRFGCFARPVYDSVVTCRFDQKGTHAPLAQYQSITIMFATVFFGNQLFALF